MENKIWGAYHDKLILNGVDIGGPSGLFEGIYEEARGCDIVNYSKNNIWSRLEEEIFWENQVLVNGIGAKAIELIDVSIIIPVYNTIQYIDECLESVVNQTYKNIDIVLINDGSTDGSAEKCMAWSQKDPRIHYIDKANEGAGPTRTLGVHKAKGEYIAFVDGDDWVEQTFIEKMLSKIKEQNADIVECDYYKIFDYSLQKSYVSTTTIMGKKMDIEEQLLCGGVTTWHMMLKKSLWLDNNIEQPQLWFEDLSIYAILLTLSKKNCVVDEALYFYRKSRSGNTSSKKETYFDAYLALQYLLREFQKRDLFYSYQAILQKHCLRWFSRFLSPCLTLLPAKEYFLLKANYCNFMDRNFKHWKYNSVMILGGYNLTKIVNKLDILEDPYCRFNFTSLISLMSKSISTLSFSHQNPYRNFMIERDLKKEFCSVISDAMPHYIFIDFIEERFDIIEYSGSYFTKSDAFVELDYSVENSKEVSRFSEECDKLWKDACLHFIGILKSEFVAENVILVKNYLTKSYGNIYQQYPYEASNDILKVNYLLEKYYQFLEENYNGISVIEAHKEEYYFTDEKYEFGRYPWHLNELVNMKIAEKISDKLCR